MDRVKNFAKDFMTKFKEDNVPLLAAAQSYYYLLAIFPLIIVGFTIIPYFNINPNDAVNFIGNVLPSEIASVFEENIVSLVETPQGGLLTVGILGALWAASNGINAFIKSSNAAYGVEETRSFIVVRLIALGLTLGMIVALVIAFVLPVFGNIIIGFLESLLGISESMTLLFQVLRWTISILVLSGLLMMLYRFAPNKKIPFKHIIPGALTASVLWQLISLGFSFYVSNFGNYSATYGSLGGIIVLMIWFFLTGLILMTGAVINVLYHRKQRRADPEKNIASGI
ncbi:YihY/virulence factor BrkB family protein [Virgibacillus sp. NKC19-16]|uniref:YihY/virulence factor BrkB family protein n=1 Tax=Virgibacillus salidurans TaxID=2831673 RepID=UPI001F20B45B|nr:YihY/virulence factor BrkB family protein [Virgibacillus sp. NKC19-16]UJL46590.1 YihY/virulence factor BrkB family protein [Virgibacillus sp. NKC19-16]